MAKYWVVGGEYRTTNFRVIADGGEEERYGPYDDRDAARAKWAELAMATVDNAHIRYRIDKEDSTEFWVVGGVYADTGFSQIDEARKERYGPFKTEDEALEKWREKAWETVDDAFAQYRIESR